MAKTLTGQRAIVYVNNAPVGIFTSLSYDYSLSLVPIDILGRSSPAELVHTGQAPINITASGWRVLGASPTAIAAVPQLQDLLTVGYVEFVVYDRETNTRMARIHSVKSTGYSTGFTAKSALEVTCHYMGLLADDESTNMSEAPGAADLPAPSVGS